jgi:hypothetical protein
LNQAFCPILKSLTCLFARDSWRFGLAKGSSMTDKDASKPKEYTEEEAKRRYEQALKGAFKTPPQQMKEVPSKRPKPAEKK